MCILGLGEKAVLGVLVAIAEGTLVQNVALVILSSIGLTKTPKFFRHKGEFGISSGCGWMDVALLERFFHMLLHGLLFLQGGWRFYLGALIHQAGGQLQVPWSV